jgi:hypothetical protein
VRARIWSRPGTWCVAVAVVVLRGGLDGPDRAARGAPLDHGAAHGYPAGGLGQALAVVPVDDDGGVEVEGGAEVGEATGCGD